ncbi:MAG: glycosyltransferase family A protein [Candidatus Paceibacterota bacterium]|jgi:hypothetical protein
MIIAQISTIPGREQMLKNTVHSLINQVDRLRVVLNYEKVPTGLEGCEIMHLNNHKGDAGKTYELPREGYIFLCDDDLIYPPDYVNVMIHRLESEKNKIILTCHGRIMREKPVANSYTDRLAAFHCLKTEIYDGPLSIGGTGVMAFNTDYFFPDYAHVKSKNMLDIWVAKFAHEQLCTIKLQPHNEGWILYQNPEHTIWDDAFFNPTEQTELYNSFL